MTDSQIGLYDAVGKVILEYKFDTSGVDYLYIATGHTNGKGTTGKWKVLFGECHGKLII